MSMDFSNRVVIITGASSGIGAGAAEYLSSLGAKVVLTGRNEVNLNKTVEKCKGEVLPLVTDVNVESDRVKIVNETLKKFGKIDVLVNNAGIGGTFGDVMTATTEQFDEVMNTNVRSVFHLTQLVAPHLIKTKGNVVNISSVAGLRSFPGALVYCMSKAALDQFTRCSALDMAPHGVRVNSVNPAVIVTDFHKRVGMDETAYQAYLTHCKTTHALGRVGTVEDTSRAIAFLACNEMSSFITGTNLAVDGGKTVMTPR